MTYKNSNIVIGALLVGGIAHLMIFQNGYWSDILWMSVLLNVAVPLVVYKFLTKSKKRRRVTRLPPKEL